jgi:hypothetical protein
VGGKVITTTTTCPEPVLDKEKMIKGVVAVVDNDTHTYAMFEDGADGKQVKTMTIKYTRAK